MFAGRKKKYEKYYRTGGINSVYIAHNTRCGKGSGSARIKKKKKNRPKNRHGAILMAIAAGVGIRMEDGCEEGRYTRSEWCRVHVAHVESLCTRRAR